MNKDLNITEEEYKEINAVDDDSIKVNKKNIGKVSINILKYFIFLTQKSIVLLSKIFQSEKQDKNKRKLPSSIKTRGESEKDREIKVLENLYSKKLNKDYIDKLSIILYSSKNKTDYPQKRNNLQKTIYKYDDKNELYLTLPKLRNKNRNQNAINNNFNAYLKTDTTEYTTDKVTNNILTKQYSEEDDILDENIKEILYDNENGDEEDEKGKILYDRLKTKYDIFENEENNNTERNYKSLPKINKKKNKKNKKQIPSEYKLIATPQQISEFDYNLGKSFINGNLRYLTRKQKEKLAYIAELNLFNSIDRIKEKTDIIKEIKTGSQNRKTILMPIDFFKYDASKWKKISNEKNKNLNNIAIHELNDKNREKLNSMRDYINKLNVDAFIADKEVNKTISNINNFLTRYGVDAINSRRDSKSSTRSIRLLSKSKNEKIKNEE